ncbi:MAG TPA: YncE family protein [Thermosulfurimonas dismutans]|uniref:YncE family protein n=1 Tax=Thermosulfurimonas dismutans TaxID=999894 RepID=A0A7C3GLB0_9BACT|nr:YncE family protein [Thermosulfurimonas dismutans]
MRAIAGLVLISLILMSAGAWAASARVAVFVNMQKLPGFEVGLKIKGVWLKGEGGEEEIPLMGDRIRSGVSFGQTLLAFGKVAPGRYRALRVRFGKVRARGRNLSPVQKERVFPLRLEVHKGETVSLFLIWDVADSLGEAGFVPRFSLKVQEPPLPGENLFVDTEDTDTLWVITTDLNRVVYSLGVCREPKGMVSEPGERKFYVVCEGDKTIVEVGTGSYRVEDVIPVPLLNSPRYIALGPEGKALLSSPDDRMVALLDLRQGNLVRYRRLSYEPGEVAYIENLSRFAVSSPHDGTVYFLDADLQTVGRISAGFTPRGLAVDDTFLYVADEEGGVQLYRLPGLEPAGRVSVCQRPVRVLGVDDRVFVSCEEGELAVLLSGHQTVSRRLHPGRGAFSMVYYSPRRWLYVALREAGGVAVVDFNREKIMGNIQVGGKPFEMVVSLP